LKILVIQIKIGNKDFHNIPDTEDYFEFEKSVCIPSVKNWANKCGYDYKMITTSSINDDTFFKTEQHKYSAERLMHLHNDYYDYIIYIDTDILVTENCPKFPIANGLTALVENIPEKLWIKLFPNIDSTKHNYLNAGVFSVDKETGKKITKYFKDRLESGDNRNVEYADQDILNAWQFNNSYNKLDDSWNYMLWHKHINPEITNANSRICKEVDIRFLIKQDYTKFREAKFIHFVSDSKYLFEFFYDIYHNTYEYRPPQKNKIIPKLLLNKNRKNI
jgi:hypothetical protein